MTSAKSEDKSVSLTIPETILELASRLSREKNIDRSTFLREWLCRGAEDAVIRLLERGDISKGYAVKVLGITYHDINHLLEARGVRLGPSEEQIRRSQDTAKHLKRHMRL